MTIMITQYSSDLWVCARYLCKKSKPRHMPEARCHISSSNKYTYQTRRGFLTNQVWPVLPESRRAEKPAIPDRAGVRLGGVAGSREHDPPALLLGRTPHPCSLQRSLA